MLNLVQYETAGFIKGRKPLAFILVAVVLALGFVGIGMISGVRDGYQALFESLIFHTSLFVFVCPILAGVVLSQSFEERQVQSAIMSGKSRWSVVVAKSLLLMLFVFFLMLLATLISTLGMTLSRGWNVSGAPIAIGPTLTTVVLYAFLVTIAFSVVLPIAFALKKVGSTIGLGLAATLALQVVTQELVKNEATHAILKLTPLGRSYFVLMEMGPADIVAALAVGVVWIAIYTLASYLIIRKAELK